MSDHGTTTFSLPTPITPPTPITAWLTFPSLGSIRSASTLPTFLPVESSTVVPMMSPVSCRPCVLLHACRSGFDCRSVELRLVVPRSPPLPVVRSVPLGADVWASALKMIRRGDAAINRGRTKPQRRTLEEELGQEMLRSIGVGFDEIAPLVGREGVFAMCLGDGPPGSFDAFVQSLLFIVKTPDPEKAKAVAGKFMTKFDPCETTKEGDATLVFAKDKQKVWQESCKTLNRIIMFDHDGRPIYDRSCTGSVVTADLSPDPITVPLEVGDGVAPGKYITFGVSNSQERRISLPYEVYADKKGKKLTAWYSILL